MTEPKKDIRACSKDQLREFFVAQGDQAFRGNQVYEWLWSKGAQHLADMPNGYTNHGLCVEPSGL